MSHILYDSHKKETKDESMNSKHHTLFKKKIPEKLEATAYDKTLFKKIPAHTNYRIFIDRFFEQERGLHEIFNELLDSNQHDKLELRINSGGGLVNEGMQFYTIIKNKFYKRTTTVLDASGYSMGALLFCMGDKRVITPTSDLMFHDYSGGMWGKGGELKSRMKHKDSHIRGFFKQIIYKQNFLTQEEYKNMLMGKDFWFDAKALCKRGIATHVLYNSQEISAKKYLKILKKQK
jgi:ATP-dependent protease ClpP protease subunit